MSHARYGMVVWGITVSTCHGALYCTVLYTSLHFSVCALPTIEATTMLMETDPYEVCVSPMVRSSAMAP